MFLTKLLPSEGLYCVALLLPSGKFKHHFHADLPAAEAQLEALNGAGHTVYIAQATFDPEKIAEAQKNNAGIPRGLSTDEWKKLAKRERSQDNALYLRNFFLDIDCGEKWALKSQQEGAIALREFILETGLPSPAVVNSGNGLYAQWLLEDNVPAMQWRTVARLLKQVVKAYKPALGDDSSRTADSASVLRPPGTTNRKPGKEAKPVVLLRDMAPIPFMTFVRALGVAARKKQIKQDAIQPPKVVADINAEFATHTDIPSKAELVAGKCAQIALMRDTRGDLSEPLWYACLGVLLFCENGDAVIHEWSNGHPGYNPAQTDSKISQWRNSGMGPATCANIGSNNSQACIGCPNNGKIKSPIVLGRPEPENKELPVEECEAPDGFRRSDAGLYAEEEGRWLRFYDCDLAPVKLAYDASLGYEVMTIRHRLPHEGELECTVRSSLVQDPKAFITTLSDNHIKVVGVKEKKLMTAYFESYAAKLQRQRRMAEMLTQMGWATSRNGETMFILGKKVFRKDGTAEVTNLAANVPKAAGGFRSAGDPEKWAEMTKVFTMPAMEPFAFAFLAGAFGAPLMRFTGFEGAMISMWGESGSGKTLVSRMAQSAWGYHKDLMMMKGDTANSLIARLGVYGSLPLTIDEVTNIEGLTLSDLAYQITQGREKVRLTRNAKERDTVNKWNTLAVTTSNASLVERLCGAKQDASAEINRIFEYQCYQHDKFREPLTKEVYWTLHENYGHAGEKYAQWLVAHEQEIKTGVDKIAEKIIAAAQMKSEERFWAAAAAVAIYGGLIAQKLGLIRFSVSDVYAWVVQRLYSMREVKADLKADAISVLGEFIDTYSANMVVVKEGADKVVVIEPPRGALVIRFAVDTGRLWLSRAILKQWLAKKFGSYAQMRDELLLKHVLLDANKRKTMSAGTVYGGAQQVCWEMDMRNPELHGAAWEVVERADELSRSPLRLGEKVPAKEM